MSLVKGFLLPFHSMAALPVREEWDCRLYRNSICTWLLGTDVSRRPASIAGQPKDSDNTLLDHCLLSTLTWIWRYHASGVFSCYASPSF